MDPDFDPLAILDELAHELVRLNERQTRVELYLQELAEQHANIAEHLADQSNQIYQIYYTLGKMNEAEQSAERDRKRRP